MSIDLDIHLESNYNNFMSKHGPHLDTMSYEELEELYDNPLFYTNFSGNSHRLFDILDKCDILEDPYMNHLIYDDAYETSIHQLMSIITSSTDHSIQDKYEYLIEILQNIEDKTQKVYLFVY